MPAHNNGGLLFVNKTSFSRSFSNNKGDAEDLKEIYQHAQKSRDYEEERETRKRLRRSRLLSSGRTPIAVAPRQVPSAATLPTPPETPISNGVRPLAIAFNGMGSEQLDHGHCKSTLRENGVPSLSLVTPSGSSREPFGQFNISMNAEKYRILEYFVRRFLPAATRSNAGAFMGQSQASPTSPAVQLVRSALSDELHVLALLSAASGRMKFVEGLQFSRADLPERLADATLRLLRSYLAQGKPISHELLQTIFYLWSVESYRRNWENVHTHGKMILYLADNNLGGFRNMDPQLQRMLWIADRFQAAATQTPPLIKERWKTERLLPHQYSCAVKGLQKNNIKQPMGYGFVEVGGLFTPGFRLLLESVLDLCCIIHCHWVDFPEQDLIPDRHWAIGRSYFIIDELITFSVYERGSRPLDREGKMQDCVRLALIIWMAFVPTSFPYAAAAKLPFLRAAVDAKALRNMLEGLLGDISDQAFGESEQLLLFWVAGLGAMTSAVDEGQEWFTVQFQQLAKRLGVLSWDQFALLQERFLMLDTLKLGNLTRLKWLLQRAVHANVGD